MKIGFLLQRATDLKSMGPLAEEALGSGHTAHMLYSKTVAAASKRYLSVTREDLTPLADMGAETAGVEQNELAGLRAKHGIDALVVQEGYHSLKTQLDDLQGLRKAGVRLISLSHFFEITKRPLEALDSFDKTLYISEYARDLHFRLQLPKGKRGEAQQARADHYAVTGSPMFDQIGRSACAAARNELGLPTEQRVVLLVAPVIEPTTPWRYHVWRDANRLGRTREAIRASRWKFLPEIWMGGTFREVYEALVDFCERHDAQLLVKSRGKQTDLAYMQAGAVKYWDGTDDEYYPQFTTYKLMAAADLCVTVNSMAGAEAVAAGRPCMNIYVPHIDRAVHVPAVIAAYMDELLDGRPGSLMNYDGCILKVDRRQVVDWLRNASWGNAAFRPVHSETYKSHFLGMGAESASQRVLEKMAS